VDSSASPLDYVVVGNKNRVQGLDALRAVAIGSVLFFHLGKIAEELSPSFSHPALNVLQFGKFGVELFFCISGYVISLSLNNHKSAKVFIAARFFRLWPSLIIVNGIIALLWISTLFPHSFFVPLSGYDFFISILLIDPTLLNLFLTDESHWTTGVLWSLSIEIIFYVASAVGWYFLKIRSHLSISFLVLIYATLHYFLKFFELPETLRLLDTFLWGSTVLYLPWFVIGSILFEITSSRMNIKRNITHLFCVILFLQAAMTQSRDFNGLLNSFIFLLAPVLITLITWVAITKNLSLDNRVGRSFLFLGSISYDFYLCHEFFITLIAFQIDKEVVSLNGKSLLMVLVLTSASVFTLLAARTIESLANKIRRAVRR